MNYSSDTPLIDSAFSSNKRTFEFGLQNPIMQSIKGIISDYETIYPLPFDQGVKFPSLDLDEIVLGTVSQAYFGGVFAPNGKIYCIPFNATTILEIDPIGRTSSTFGSLSSTTAKWAGGVLAGDGKIYCTPRIATSILEIDPVTKKTVEYSHVGGTYNGAVLGVNGKVYFMPYATTSGDIMEFDPYTKQMKTFGNVGTLLTSGGVLAPNGNIYCAPYSAEQVAVINPESNSVKTFTSADSGASNSLYSGGVLAPNGKIYFVPFNATKILVVDPITDTSYSFGSLSSSTSKYAGGYVAPDGYIYFMNYSSKNGTTGINQLLRLDWRTEITEIIEIPNSIVPAGQSANFYGVILTPFGCAIGIPHSNDGALILNHGYSVNPYICLSNVINRF